MIRAFNELQLLNSAELKIKHNQFVICRIYFNKRFYNGLLCGVDSTYLKQCILPHEKFYADCSKSLVHDYKIRLEMTSPILLTAPDLLPLERFIDKVIAKKQSDFQGYLVAGGRLELWFINYEDFPQKLFKNLSQFFLVDGHHRREAIIQLLKMYDYGFDRNALSVFSLVMPKSQLGVGSYSRYVSGDFDLNLFTQNLSKIFRIEKDTDYKAKCLRLKILGFHEDKNFDVHPLSVFHELFLPEYTSHHSAQQFSVSWSSSLTKARVKIKLEFPEFVIENILKIAMKRKLLPQKSTQFEPKLKESFLSVDFSNNLFINGERDGY